MRSGSETRATLALVAAALLASACGVGLQTSAQTSAWEPSSTTFYHQGIAPGPSVTTNQAGALSEERRYEAFGQGIEELRPGVGVVAVDYQRNPQNILGKQTSPNTGWSYHGARWMAPQTARWLTPDPAIKGPEPAQMVAPWNLNPYAYATGNPTLFWDPDGQRSSWRDNTPLWVRAVATVFLAAPVLDWAESRAHEIEDHPHDPVAKAKVIFGAPVVAYEHAKGVAKRSEVVARTVESTSEWFDRHVITGTGPYGTHKNEAVFWSGIGNKQAKGYDVAEAWAGQHGGKTLEMMLKEKHITLPIYDPNNPATVQAWQDASRTFAMGARGDVRVLLTGAPSPRSTWQTIEFDALRQNPDVTSITAVNPQTNQETLVWQRP